MKIPHPFKKAKEKRAQMRHDAKQQLKDFDPKTYQSPVNNKIIWFFLVGFMIMLCLKLVSVWIGG